jgi:hypothetical protein
VGRSPAVGGTTVHDSENTGAARPPASTGAGSVQVAVLY